MSRRYDQRTTTFSPEGRLYQVEYAMEAINHAGTCLGILTENGILIAAEKRTMSKLLDDQILLNEKIYRINENMICTVAGITADANVLVSKLRWFSAKYKHDYSTPIPCEQLVQFISDQKQFYTQRGGKRPFGVSLLYSGWDQHFGFQLYQSDPSGNYTGWKATAIGCNHQKATSLFKEEYKASNTLLEAKKLAIKAIAKCIEGKLTGEKVEMAFLTRKNDKVCVEESNSDEITALIKDYEQRMKEQAETEAAKVAKKK